MDTLFPTLSVTLSQKRWTCILDPTLILGSPGLQGLALARYLGHFVELWVARELWHILDNTHFYLEQSEAELQTLTEPDQRLQHAWTPHFDQEAIHAWEHIRLKTDLAGLKISWLGDAVGQSCLPTWIKDGVDPEAIIQHYEFLAQSLEPQLSSTDRSQPFALACRETVALLATLGTGMILTCAPKPDYPPYIVDCLERWQIPCQRRPLNDPIAAIARRYWHHLFVHAGLPQLLWSPNLHLAVLHLDIPTAFHPSLRATPWAETEMTADDFESEWDASLPPLASEINPWQSAQGYWYSLQTLPMSPLEDENTSLSSQPKPTTA
ncbi:hypothetical protein [Acaryochloris sp. IP29b_bin.148]|uniref:hypothetical protein n=1 Tax=Acaryochloris sp. IP29b_bin.148 TaxID=2969218 RepID=UPI00260DF5CD|nr:hypothetical protein [Acaryochloris sp. IP29b_bin.148]